MGKKIKKIIISFGSIFDNSGYIYKKNISKIYQNNILDGFEVDSKNIQGDFYNSLNKYVKG